jgi:MFS family permease
MPPEQQRSWRTSVWVLLPSVLLTVVGYGVTIPVFAPYLVQSFTACNTDDDDCVKNTSAAAAFKTASDVLKALINVFCAPAMGALSDRFGRRPVILVTTAVVSIAPYAALLVVGKSTVPFLVVSALSGVGASGAIALPALVPCIADMYPPAERSAANGLVYFGAGVAIALSPVFALLGNTGGFHPRRCFALSLWLGVANLLYCYFVLPETAPCAVRRGVGRGGVEEQEQQEQEEEQAEELAVAFEEARGKGEGGVPGHGGGGVLGGGSGGGGVCASVALGWRASKALLRGSPLFGTVALVTFLITLPESGLVEVALLYFDDALGTEKGESARNNSLLLVVVGCTVVLVSLSISSVLRCTTELKMLFYGTCFSGVHLALWALLTWVPQLWLACATEVVGGLGFVAYPVLTSMAMACLRAEDQGVGSGVIFATKAATNVVGPLFFGLTFARLREGGHFFGRDLPQFPFLVAVLIFTYAAWMIRFRLVPHWEKAGKGAWDRVAQQQEEEKFGAREGGEGRRSELRTPLVPAVAEGAAVAHAAPQVLRQWRKLPES